MRKDTTLYCYWSKRAKDFLFCYPGSKSDGHMLHQWFSPGLGLFGSKPSLYDELEARGYDTTTLKFSIKRKVCPKCSGTGDIHENCLLR